MPGEAQVALSAMAGALAHDANNLIGKLFAASSWLDDAPEPEAIDEARLALSDAVASATGLQAVLQLLSLTPSHPAPADGQPERLSLTAQSQLFLGLREAAGVHGPQPSPQWSELAIPFEVDTLRALLVCAARLLRRQAGAQAVLHVELSLLGQGQWRIALSAPGVPREAAGRTEQRAEALALSHAARCLGLAALPWEAQQSTPGLWQLTLPGGAK